MKKSRTPAVAHLRFALEGDSLRELPLARRFERIYETNLWGSPDSRSGLGSEFDATAHLRAALPALLRELGVRTLLDVPCGDCGWISRMELDCEYTGADIVPALIERNRVEYAATHPGWRFTRLDLTSDPLPRAGLVLSRDCLVHLSFQNILRALENLKASGSEWLLTTTFTDHDENQDIADGDWRPLNLQQAPFHLPAPQALIIEGCTEAEGSYADKALGLWRIADLPGRA
ncbi:MAG TPA: class I SAM-dependent methyltransferase [Bryobacteraceae bacterium]|nr:class I SAM-dependent methyltransferase [Bryobacteraceae bacterium]